MTIPIADITHWGYQLQNANPDTIASSAFDLVVIDYSRDGTENGAYSAVDVAHMETKSSGGARAVVAYMSIGEAEDYRYYWHASWKTNPPGWLDRENPEWHGNYKVKYWDPDWQHLIFGNPDSYLDKIIHAGFSGVYLDIVDAFEYYEKRTPDAALKMVDFIVAISAYAKSINPDFLIIPQNGESLLANPDYLAAIDAIGKEDLFTDGSRATPAADLAWSQSFLDIAEAAGKPVFSIEYMKSPDMIAEYVQLSYANGYTPYVGPRDLDSLYYKVPATADGLWDATHAPAHAKLGTRHNDIIKGTSGHDRINGLAGHDVMYGGKGDDTYYVDRGDKVVERFGEGTDLVRVYCAEYKLGAHIENAQIIKNGGAHVVGNDLANIITGGKGDDTIEGGRLGDYLLGGGGHDTFVYRSLRDGGDVIGDFLHGSDVLDLRPLLGNLNGAETHLEAVQTGVAVIVDYQGASHVLATLNGATIADITIGTDILVA